MDRYTSQIAFLGKKAHEHLSKSTVAVIGLGALGSVAAELLARAGIGTIILIDHDIVELSNLQRQALYDEKDISKLKAEAASAKLKKINSSIEIIPQAQHIDETTIKTITAGLILDCTDNLETRFIINKYCHAKRIPWVHAAAVGSIGIILPITNNPDTYCFNCIYANAKSSLTCGDKGILNTTSYATASFQVTEAIKMLTKQKHSDLIRFNSWTNTFDLIKVKKNPSCDICTKKETASREKATISFTISKCTTRAGYSAKPSKNIHLNLTTLKQHFNTIVETPIVLVIKENETEIIVHEFGEILFKTMTDEKKMHTIAKKIYEVGL